MHLNSSSGNDGRHDQPISNPCKLDDHCDLEGQAIHANATHKNLKPFMNFCSCDHLQDLNILSEHGFPLNFPAHAARMPLASLPTTVTKTVGSAGSSYSDTSSCARARFTT